MAKDEVPRGRTGAKAGAARCPRAIQLPLGHGKNLATLPLGVHATLNADALTIDEPALTERGEPRSLEGERRTA